MRHLCIAPGSRSTPLVTVADVLRREHLIKIHTHFDERGLGFYALGLAKKTEESVAVIVTSGTAVANLFPAVAEAFITKEKLILLTADRPPNLVGCGANQAIEQNGIFSSHLTDALFLPAPTFDIPATWILSRVDELLYKQKLFLGPVHINCPYAAPFYGGNYDAHFPEYVSMLTSWFMDTRPFVSHFFPECQNCQPVSDEIWNKKGMILIGAIKPSDQVAVKAFALATGWPVLTDIQSGLVSDWPGYDIWLTMPNVLHNFDSLEVVIQFGSRLISQSLEQVLKYKYALKYYLIDDNTENQNPSHRRIEYIHHSPTNWIQAQNFEAYSQCNQSGWGDKLKYYARKTLSYVDSSVSSELSLVQKIDALLPQDSGLFLGNSTVIRLFNNFISGAHPHVYANRGASGIDGLIATAAGVANGNKKQSLCAVIGDLSALHDLNSLVFLTKIRQPFILVISNNAGGAIFDRFPIAPHAEDLYQMYHDFHFEHAATMFGIDYSVQTELSGFEKSFTRALEEKKATIIEYMTEPKETDNLVMRIKDKLQTMEKLTLVKE